MLHRSIGTRGIVTAPHNLAAQAGLAVLREGGNASEAMVAAAAAIAVVYPHMNALGGDGFWLIATPGAASTGLKLESRIAVDTVEALYRAGHAIEVLGAFEDTMGHAGALVRHGDRVLEGAADPRGNGCVAAY